MTRTLGGVPVSTLVILGAAAFGTAFTLTVVATELHWRRHR